ncbi:amidase signature (AS) enzyme-4 [Coleophoma crateriformis]|uniref:Amidase signature (AS) enzyme-4 n=1 Tax=Coleophoma crateriformis TaxID=565419 RepID=A0A3D8RQ88_9HELO|nr:amidase signature (AS) enzyme-4 [Coleophoma crateriformis]
MSMLTVTPKEGINITLDDLLKATNELGYELDPAVRDDYTTLLGATFNALQVVSEMEANPEPGFSTKRRDPFPRKKDNPDNAWGWRFKLKHKNPSSDLLKDKTICVKDNICVAGVTCMVGTDSFVDWVPKTDASIITRMIEAGACITGKSVCENLSVSCSSFSAATGPINNPYAEGYSAGGSSSGTGNLVALNKVDMGIGCDQGGSIRIPAGLCGLYGFKATAGLIPYTGIVSNEAIVDYAGPMTRTCMENAVLLEVLAGVDGLDDRQRAGTPFPKDVPKYSELLKQSEGIKGMRIGILKEGVSFSGIDPEVESKFRAAAAVFSDLGAVVEEVSIPLHSIAPVVFSAMSKQGSHIGRLGRSTGRRQVMLTDMYEKMLPYTQESIDKMSIVSKASQFSGEYSWKKFPHIYAKAVNINRKIAEAYDEALTKYDVLIMPTTITPADPLPAPDASPLEKMSKTAGKLENTCPFNASGHPALAMPIGFVTAKQDKNVRVPTSLQIVGKNFDEATILKVAYAWECEKDWKKF